MGVGGLEVGADCDEAGGALSGLEGPGDLAVLWRNLHSTTYGRSSVMGRRAAAACM